MNASRPDLSKYVVLDDVSVRTDRIWLRVSDRLERRQHSSGRRISQLLALSAALALAFVAGVFLTRSRAPSAWARLETSGEPIAVELRDGSRLTLQRNTRLDLNESSEAKVSLELEQGHLDCDVRSNRQRTFSVTAAGFEVVVFGTQFGVDLSRERNRLEVEVRAGEVRVQRRTQSHPEAILNAGQRWAIDLEGTPAATPAPAAPAAGGPVALPALPNAALRPAPDAGPASAAPPASPPVNAPSAAPDARPARPALAPVPVPVPVPERQLGARRLLDQGNAARRVGDVGAATRAFELLLSTYPDDRRAGLAAFELGRLRMDRIGDVRGAVVPLQQAAKLVTDPGLREDAMARLVRVFELLGDEERCLEARGLYLDAHPTGVHVSSVAQACGVNAN